MMICALVPAIALFTILPCGVQSQTGNERAALIAGVRVKAERPRIWLDSAALARLRLRFAGVSPAEVEQLTGRSMEGRALAWLITGERRFARQAVAEALGDPIDPGSPHSDLASPDGFNKREAVQPSAAQRAIVYDWCYPLLSKEEKSRLRNAILPEAEKLMHNGRLWRSFHNTGHTSTWPVLAAALALAGDHEFSQRALAFLGPELDDALSVFDSLFGDGEWPEGIDYNRHSTFPAMKSLLALKSASGLDFLTNSPHFRNAGLYVLYAAKPNGLMLPGDDNDWSYLGEWEHVGLLMLASHYRDGFVQYFLNHCPAERFALPEDQKWTEVLWRDPSIPERNPSELPRSRLFRGKGLVLARSGWGWDRPGQRDNSSWLSFHCGDYYGDHAHYDLNSFEIYYKGELAIDSGRYDSDWNFFDDPVRLSQSQFFNYYQRTIAHNTVLAFDPEEQFEMGVANDGGQLQLLFQNRHRNAPEDWAQGSFPSDSGRGTRDWTTNPGRWETGEIIAYQSGEFFVYVEGDASRAYSSRKLRTFVRRLFFVYPDLVAVFDRVVATDPGFRKTWLLHSVEAPEVASGGNEIRIRYGEGQLRLLPLLPLRRTVTTVGGPGREFEVGGKAFRCCLDSPINPAPLHYGELPGAWRIEISPSDPALEDTFLHLLLLGDRDRNDLSRVEFTETDETARVVVRRPDGTTVSIGFDRGGTRSPYLRIGNDNGTIYDGPVQSSGVPGAIYEPPDWETRKPSGRIPSGIPGLLQTP